MTESEIAAVLKPLRIVILAMPMGIIAFGVTATIVVTGGAMPLHPELANLLLGVLGGLVVLELVGYTFVRRAVIAWQRRQWEAAGEPEPTAAGFGQGFQTATLLPSAMNEGASLFGVVIYLLTGHWAGLVAAGLGLILFGLLVPSAEKFRRFASEVIGRPCD